MTAQPLALPTVMPAKVGIHDFFSGARLSAPWSRPTKRQRSKGLMQRREASINDVPIRQADRLFRWPQSPRPVEHP
jgi:hypothetical protein